jgi:hypothetical protein
MASGDVFAIVHPKDLIPQNGLAYEVPLSAVVPPSATTNLGGAASGILGVPLNKDGVHAYQFESKVPVNGTPLPTGLTFSFGLVDDPMNPGAGLNIRLGVTVKPIGSTQDYSQTAAGVETLVTVTMPATSGVFKNGALAVPNASLVSLGAGGRYLVQVRRVGTDVLDTHTGVVLMTAIFVSDT